MTAFEPDLEKWDAWRPEQAAELLADVEVPWYVAAGWAIDLFLGEEPREHSDLEIAVPNARFDEVAEAFAAFEIFVVTPPKVTPLAEARDVLPDTHQTWIREPESGTWRLDVFREPSDGDTWVYRRDPTIRLAYTQVIDRTDEGIPYGRPEIILLYKAKHSALEKNQRDFAATLPRLEQSRRDWLRAALERVHPGHEWLTELAA